MPGRPSFECIRAGGSVRLGFTLRLPLLARTGGRTVAVVAALAAGGAEGLAVARAGADCRRARRGGRSRTCRRGSRRRRRGLDRIAASRPGAGAGGALAGRAAAVAVAAAV